LRRLDHDDVVTVAGVSSQALAAHCDFIAHELVAKRNPFSPSLLMVSSSSACPGEVEAGSPTRTCANTGIYGVFRSYGITE
jgi:hypothetical protein